MRNLRLLAACTLVVGGVLLTVAHVRAAAGVVELTSLREALASRGGGVVFVRNPEDCGTTTGPVEYVAAELQGRGVVVKGVILRRGQVDVAVRMASRAFPHESLSPRATTSLHALGHVRTPLALVVDASGAVVSVETFDGKPVAVILRSLSASTGAG